MSSYDGMARDAGYTGDLAKEVARTLEEEHREDLEREAYEAELPPVGSHWERDEDVYRVDKVYPAQRYDGAGGFEVVTLVQVTMVDSVPRNPSLEKFYELYTPYDPDVE